MIRSTFVGLSMFAAIQLSAQQLLPVQHDTVFHHGTFSHELILSATAEYTSTSLDNELTRRFLYGGQITEELKNYSFKNQKKVNRFGADISGDFEYRNYVSTLFKKDRIGFMLKGGYYNYASLLYGKDLFGLIFYGNERYLDQSADFSGTRFLGMSFQKMGFGFFDKQTKNSATLNLYSVSNFAEGNIKAGQLFQSASADSVSLTLDGTMKYSSSKSFSKGLGAGMDLDFRIPIRLKNKKTAIIRLEAKNLGICSFTQPITRYQSDTTTHLNGYTLEQLLSFEAKNVKPSLLDTLGVDQSQIRKWRFLPAYIQIGKIVSEQETAKIQTYYGIRMYGLAAYLPMVYAGLQYKLAPFAHLGVSMMAGGFGNLRFAFYSNWRFSKCSLAFGSENMLGIFYKYAKGESLSVRLRCVI
jgi:hypothetical protein